MHQIWDDKKKHLAFPIKKIYKQKPKYEHEYGDQESIDNTKSKATNEEVTPTI